MTIAIALHEIHDKSFDVVKSNIENYIGANYCPDGWYWDGGDTFFQPVEGHEMMDEWRAILALPDKSEFGGKKDKQIEVSFEFDCVQSFDK